jgi:hypothetical protein
MAGNVTTGATPPTTLFRLDHVGYACASFFDHGARSDQTCAACANSTPDDVQVLPGPPLPGPPLPEPLPPTAVGCLPTRRVPGILDPRRTSMGGFSIRMSELRRRLLDKAREVEGIDPSADGPEAELSLMRDVLEAMECGEVADSYARLVKTGVDELEHFDSYELDKFEEDFGREFSNHI